MDISKAYLDIAETDLKVARLLYKRKYYPHAVFFLQQYIEKIFKFFGTIGKSFSQEELKKKIGHNPLKILSISMGVISKIIKENSSIKSENTKEIVYLKMAELFANIGEATNFYENTKKHEELSKEELISSLLEAAKPEEREKLRSDMSVGFEDAIKFVVQSLFKKNLIDISNKELNSILNPYIQSYIRIIDNVFYLIMLALLLPSSCVENTRYPVNDDIPKDIYTEFNPIIREFSMLIDLCEGIMKSFLSFYNEFILLEDQYND